MSHPFPNSKQYSMLEIFFTNKLFNTMVPSESKYLMEMWGNSEVINTMVTIGILDELNLASRENIRAIWEKIFENYEGMTTPSAKPKATA